MGSCVRRMRTRLLTRAWNIPSAWLRYESVGDHPAAPEDDEGKQGDIDTVDSLDVTT